MEFESTAIATGERDRPFIARITVGTRKTKTLLHEWPAASLAAAEQEGDDWLYEYLARIGGGGFDLIEPDAIRARLNRLHNGMPPLPEPCEAYCVALDGRKSVAGISLPAPAATLRPRRRSIAPSAVKRIVEAARAAGIDVAGVRIWPDGSIAAFDLRWQKDEQSYPLAD